MIKTKILLTALLIIPIFLNAQHLPCYNIWTDLFERLTIKSEFAAVVEFDILQVPKKSKYIKTYYNILSDSILDLSQDDFFSFDCIPLDTKISTELAIDSHYDKNGKLYKVSYLAVSALYKDSEYQSYNLNDLLNMKIIYCILHEEEKASLTLLSEDDSAINWQFIRQKDTVLLHTSKNNDTFLYSEMVSNNNFSGKTFYELDTNRYSLYQEMVDSVIGSPLQDDNIPLLKIKFNKYCQKEIVYNKNRSIESIFMLTLNRYAFVQFETNKKNDLVAITTKKIHNKKWKTKEHKKIEVLGCDNQGNWKKRFTLDFLGCDHRKIEYYE